MSVNMIYRTQTVNWTIIPPQTGQPTAHHAPRSRLLRSAPSCLLPCRPTAAAAATAAAIHVGTRMHPRPLIASWPLRTTACLFNTSNPSWYPHFKLLQRKYHYKEKLLLLLTPKSCHILKVIFISPVLRFIRITESQVGDTYFIDLFYIHCYKIYTTNNNNW